MTRPVTDLPLFAAARASDPQTSHDAADRITAKLTDLQQRVCAAVGGFGPLGATAREVEALPVFAACGFSTVRKRLSELAKSGRLATIGRRDGMTVYAAPAYQDAA